VHPGVEEVNVTILFPRDDIGGIINSEKPLYDLTQRNPDWSAWNRTFAYGTTHFMVYVTDFLLLMLRGKQMNELEIAFVGMKTPSFYELPYQSQTQLIQTFPIFYICIFMLPLYYMVTKLAEEKESKIRESMKMMGLGDHSYYKAWFLFNAFIGLIISTTIQLILTTDVFWMSDFLVVFAMSFIYSLNIFGISLTLTSLIPSKKGSATAASIIHILSFCFNYGYKGYSTSFYEKAFIACFMPNCAVGFMMDHLLHCEIEGGTGLNLETAFMSYQNFSYAAALGC
jgi:ABC-2 family transporter protein